MMGDLETGHLKSVFIKSVKDAFINEETIASQWKQLNYLEKPDFNKALNEYKAFESMLKETGADVHYFPKNDDVTIDSIYCRDASIATPHGMIICNMGKAARMNEPKAQKSAFEQAGIKILGEIKAPGTIEGGDVAWLDKKTLAVGHTYRTNVDGIEQLKSIVRPMDIDIVVAQLPHYKGPADVFHLMSILSPVDQNLAVVYSPLMPIDFRNLLIRRGIKLIEVPDGEFDSMGCNVLAIAPRQCLMVKGNPETKTQLENAGCVVYEYDGQEISVKGGGGPTCLTRPIIRA